MPQIVRYNECFSTKFFGTVRQNTLTKPWWPLLCVKISDARILLKNRTVPIRNFFLLWDKIFWQNRDALLLCMKIFGTRYFCETQKGSLTNFLITVKQKKFDRKSWCRSPFSAIQKFISIPESFWNNEWIPNEVFQCCETKKIRKNCDTPYYLSKFYVSVFFETHKGSPTNFLGVMRHKEIFDRTVMSPTPSRPPVNDNFRHQKFFEIEMCSPTRFIVSVKKKRNGEGWNLLLMHKILHTRNFLKYRRVTRRSLSVLWDTKRIGTTRDAPPPYYARKFSIREFSRIRERLWYDFLRHYETKNFRPKIVIPPYYAWILFDTRKFLKHRSVTQCIFSPLWDKIFWQNPDAFPLLSKIFSYIKFFWNTDVFPQEFFRHCDTICFRRKIEITLPRPLFILKFFHYQRLSEKQKGSFMKFSGHERQKVFDKPVIHPTPMHEKILYQKSFEIQMCSPTNFIGGVKKNSSEKSDILFLCMNFSIPEKFWNREKIH